MQRTESEILELKSTFGEWKEIIISLCAFANKYGGTVIVGLNDAGEPLNLDIGRQSIEDFINKLKTNTDPVLYPSVNIKTFALGQIVELYIPPSDYKPVFAFGKAYTRVGKNTLQLSVAEVRELVKNYSLPDFDRQMLELGLSDFDYDERLIRRINERFFNFPDDKLPGMLLSELKLLDRGKLTNAAYLCFVKQNKLLPAARVKAARFKGNKPVTFIDMQDFTGNIIDAVEESLAFIKKHINMGVLLDGKPVRTEMWEYPMPALREAVINAVVHRDYNDRGNIQIRIFDDSLEIWSPGLLPKVIDIDNIEETNRSVPRNQLLADVFHSLGYIEAWGTGLVRIIEYTEDFGLDKPEFRHHQNAFIVKFYKKKRNSTVFINDTAVNEKYSPYIKKNNNGLNEGLNVELIEGLNEGLKMLFYKIYYNPGCNSSQLAELIERPQKTIERWLSELKSKELIEFRGSKKTGGYFYISSRDVSC